MKRNLVTFATLLAALTLGWSGLPAQTNYALNEQDAAPLFWADVLYFRVSDSGNTLAEVFIEVPYSSLTFVRQRAVTEAAPGRRAGNLLTARLEVAVIFDDMNGFQVAGNSVSDTVRTNDFEATLSAGQTRLFLFAFPLEPGRYLMRVLLTDNITGRRHSSAVRVAVPSYQGPSLQLSSLQLARDIKVCDTPSVLQKNGRLVYPNVQHVIGTTTPRLFAYLETYNLEDPAGAADSMRVHYRIRRGVKEIASIRRTYRKPGTSAVLSVQLPIESLDLGEYELTVSVEDQNGARRATTSTTFQVCRPVRDLSDSQTSSAQKRLGYVVEPEKR